MNKCIMNGEGILVETQMASYFILHKAKGTTIFLVDFKLGSSTSTLILLVTLSTMRTVSCLSRAQIIFCLIFWEKLMSVFLNFILNCPHFWFYILSEFPSRFMFFNINSTTQRMISVVNFLDKLFATWFCTPCNQILAHIPTNLGIFPPSLKIIPTR